MRTCLSVIMLGATSLALSACGAGGAQEGWTNASATTQSLGIASYRVIDGGSATGHELIVLRNQSGVVIGQMAVDQRITQTESTRAMMLKLNGQEWMQELVPASGEMRLVLGDQLATLKFDGTSWTGTAAAQKLLVDSKPYIDVVVAIGSELHLQAAPATAAQSDTAKSPSAGAPPTPAKSTVATCCTSVPVAATGWAYFWEKKDLECDRAVQELNVQSQLATVGLDACQVGDPSDGGKSKCFNYVNWGFTRSAESAGFLQSLDTSSPLCQ